MITAAIDTIGFPDLCSRAGFDMKERVCGLWFVVTYTRAGRAGAYGDERKVYMIIKKEMIAMLLAGGQGSRLGILTSDVAKPAVSFGGKYRIIDFPLSNCINSGIDTVGVLTQYMPLRLNAHVGIGIPWDLDKNVGGVTVLSPYEKIQNTEWYTGTANAIYQNIEYMESFHPDYVLILSGDHKIGRAHV